MALPATAALVVVGVAMLPVLLVQKLVPLLKRFLVWVIRLGKQALRGILVWWITKRAIWKDSRKSVTDDPIIARMMLGRFAWR